MSESQRRMDWNGFMEVRNNPISKAGIFPYLGSEIPGAPEPDKIYNVYRPAEELERQETIDSFKLMPFIDEHEVLGIGGMPAERKGMQGVIGEQVYFDPPYLRGNLKIHSGAAQSLIKAGKVELSPCYGCDWVAESGAFEGKPYDYIQRNIMGNHLALVEEGRTGPDVAVLDHRKFTLDSKELLPMALAPEDMEAIKAFVLETLAAQKAAGDETPEENAAKEAAATDEEAEATDEEVVVESEEVVTPEQAGAAEEAASAAEEAQAAIQEVAEAIEEVAAAAEEVVAAADSKKRKAAQDKLTTAKAKLSKAKAKSTKLAADAKLKAKLAKDGAVLLEVAAVRKELAALKKAPAKDSAGFLGLVADRDQLYSRVSPFTGAFDYARMDAKALAKYACDKLSIKTAAGSEHVALDAWLQGRKPETPNGTAADSQVKGSALKEWSKK